ncbi:MAG: PDZ domain-containing protein [Flavobacteriia bacterium]|nr:PDZ domain-containing protein [Flavobacteriia bacterium]
MKKIVLAFSATLFLSSLSVCAQEAPTTCCSEKKTEQAACAEKTPAQKEACASKPADGKKACCADKAATTPAASCGEHGAAKPAASCCADKAAAKPAEGCAEHGAAKKESCAHGEGQVGKQCCGACQEGANQPKVVTGYRIQGGQVHSGEAPMLRMHRMGEGTEMTVDTIVSGDSTKVIVRVMKRANLAEGQNLEDVMIYLDGVELPAGALSGEPHVFMFKGEGMGGSDMVWNEAAPGAGNTFFMASNKGTLGVKLEKSDDIKGAFVVEVIPVSTAAALGLQANDIIVAVDGQSVTSEQSMMDRMADKKTGDAIEVTYRRDGKKKKGSGFLIPTSPAMGLPMGGMMHGMPGMHMGEASMENVEITEEVGENGEKRVKVIVIKKDEN